MLKLSILLLLIPCTAHAYLDPGTSSMYIQVIIGTLFAVTYTAKVYWKKIIMFFKKARKEPVS